MYYLTLQIKQFALLLLHYPICLAYDWYIWVDTPLPIRSRMQGRIAVSYPLIVHSVCLPKIVIKFSTSTYSRAICYTYLPPLWAVQWTTIENAVTFESHATSCLWNLGYQPDIYYTIQPLDHLIVFHLYISLLECSPTLTILLHKKLNGITQPLVSKILDINNTYVTNHFENDQMM